MEGQKRILVVDDEADLRELVEYNLGREGYDVAASASGDDALRRLRTETFDLVILDLMLPGVQGTDICRSIRANPETARLPVIMLTARGEASDKVLGLELGADDYVTKPFNPRELAARVRAVLRRTARAGEARPESSRLAFGEIEIRRDEYTVLLNGAPLDLSPTEYRLLLYLAERRGRVFTRDQLLDSVWKGEAYVEPRTVDVHVRRLRMRIEKDPASPVYIRTRRGVGYYFEGPG